MGRVHELDYAAKVTLVESRDDAVICCRRCGDDHVESASRSADLGTLGHDPRPLVGRCFVKGQDPTLEKRERSLRPAEPIFQFASFSSRWDREDSASNFGKSECRDE